MPSRPRTHQLADQSINRLHAAFEGNGWAVEDLRKDYGEDLFIRIFDGETATPYTFFVQAKATDNIAKYLRNGEQVFTFPIEMGHLRHWIRFSEPVFLSLFDSQSDQTYWVYVQDACRGVPQSKWKQRTIGIRVPCRNLLDADGLLRMRGITKLRSEKSERERLGGRVLIEMLEERFGFKVNKYEPENEYIQVDTDTGSEYFFLGALGKRMAEYERRSGMPLNEFFVKACSAFLEKPNTKELRTRLRRLGREIKERKERDAGRLPNSTA